MTKEQERARARRRQQKLDAREAQRAREAARNRQVAIVVVVVLAVVALFVFLSSQLGDDQAEPAAASTASASAPASGATASGSCSPAPKTPTKITPVDMPDKATAAGKTFEAVITTNCGDITLELDGEKAPQTVASFLALAKADYWADSPCHRLTTLGIFVLQCGDPLGGAGPGPGYTFGIENAPQDGSYPKGTLAMARTSGPQQQQRPVLRRLQGLAAAHRGRRLLHLRHGDRWNGYCRGDRRSRCERRRQRWCPCDAHQHPQGCCDREEGLT